MKKTIKEVKLLMKSIPPVVMTLFVVSIVIMNLLANKLVVNESWIAIDAGILLSWLAFLTMDMIVKRFGPKAATQVTIIAILINLLIVAILNIASILPGEWGEGSSQAINATFAGSFHVLIASTIAMFLGAITNNFLNWGIKNIFKKNEHSFKAYAVSSYGSTFVGQFVDNFVFALLFTFLNGWITLTAAIMFAVVGAIVELLMQIFFSPIGYYISENWRKQGIGDDYLELIKK